MFFEGMLEETDRLDNLVVNLLDMSKLEAGIWKPKKKTLRVDDIVHDTIGSLERTYPRHIFGPAPG